MGQPELTHYERVLQVCMPYEKEAQAFAQRAFAKGEPEKAFYEYMQAARTEVLRTAKAPDDTIRQLQVVGSKGTAFLHYLTQETLRRQEERGFNSLTVDKAFSAMVCTGCMSTNLVVTNVTGHMHYHMAMHRMAGRKVFDVNPALAEKLLHTELRGLTADDLKLPYPSIYVTVPKDLGLKIWNEDSDWHRVVGLYLTEDIDRQGRRCWRFLLCGETKPIKILPDVVDENDALIYFHVALPSKLPLTDTIALAHEEASQDAEEARKSGRDGFSKMLDKWQDIFHWAMNVVLYTSWEGAEREEVIANETAKRLLEEMNGLPKDSKKRHKLSGRLSQMQQLHRIVLGRSVVPHAGWHLTVRVLVSGHWRNQPYGPGRMLRRLQWIEPFWRGPVDEVAGTTPEVASAASGTGGAPNDARNGAGADSTVGVDNPAAQQGSGAVDEGPDHPAKVA